jgi:hypothetical protein
MSPRASAVVFAGIVCVAVVAWHRWSSGEEREIRRRLDSLIDEVNASALADGRAARAVTIASYFTEDVLVDLGRGFAPISGRVMLTEIISRLQPRTAAFKVNLEDVGARVAPDRESAEVSLTAELLWRGTTSRDQTLDAREFALDMRKDAGEWRISRVTAVDTLK